MGGNPSAAGKHRPSSVLVRGTSPCMRLAMLGRRSALAVKRSAQRSPQSGQAGPSDRHSLIFIMEFSLPHARGAAGRGRGLKGEGGRGGGGGELTRTPGDAGHAGRVTKRAKRKTPEGGAPR